MIPESADGFALVVMDGDGKVWPGWSTVRAWIRQGVPRDFPTIVQRGRIVVTISADDVAVLVEGWGASCWAMRPGVFTGSAYVKGLLARYPAEVHHPDGRVEMAWVVGE